VCAAAGGFLSADGAIEVSSTAPGHARKKLVATGKGKLGARSLGPHLGRWIVYRLDTGAIKDLEFSTYTFENSSQGKFMLQIMLFGRPS
jgi:hypothetical protein